MQNTNLRKLFQLAQQEHFGVLSFNFNDCWDMLAIIEAAEEENAPIMLEAGQKVLTAIDLEVVFAYYQAMSKRSPLPLVIHLDHCMDLAFFKRCVDIGFESVMFDGSLLPLEENIALLREATEYAHRKGCMVEGEIGKIQRGERIENPDDYLVQVEDAVRLVNETGVDSLAVAIGNAHGLYEGEVRLNFERLREVRDAIDIPLVLHGGTGIPEEHIRRAISLGIVKINVGTQIRMTTLKTLHKVIGEQGYLVQPVDVMAEVRPAVKEVVKEWIRVGMASGKANLFRKAL